MKAKVEVVRLTLLERQTGQQMAGGPRPAKFVFVEYRGVDGQVQGSYPVDQVALAPHIGDEIEVAIEHANEPEPAQLQYNHNDAHALSSRI